MPGKRKRVSRPGSDVNPQFMSFSVKQTVNDAATGGSVVPPVSLVRGGEGLAMEILKIWVENTSPAGSPSNGVNLTLSSKNFGVVFPANGRWCW
jgi:hypothetical protein